MAQSQVVIVTGSAAGIGAATARRLAGNGWRVVVNYSKSEADAQAVYAECRAAAGDALLLRGDVSLDADCRRIASETLARWGRIDALVNNAGVTRHSPFADLEALPIEDFEQLVRINVTSVFMMSRAVAPTMKAQGRGAIVNLSSRAAATGMGSSIAYAASKGALDTLTLSLARVLAPEIRVNAVAPGFVETRWHDALGAEKRAANARNYTNSTALKKTVQADEIADAVCWFIEGAAAATGQLLTVDAGHQLT